MTSVSVQCRFTGAPGTEPRIRSRAHGAGGCRDALVDPAIVGARDNREGVFLMIANTPIQAVLPASDIERARGWYAEKRGLDPVSANAFGDLRYQAGGVEFLGYQSGLAGTNQATAAGFRLDNFDEVVAFLRSNGVAFEHVDFGKMGATVDGVTTTPDGRKAAWFKGSEGNTFALSMAN